MAAKAFQPRTVKVVSDGTGRGTHLYDTETGEELLYGCIRGLRWEIDNQSKIAHLSIEIIAAQVEITGELIQVSMWHPDRPKRDEEPEE